MAGKADLTPVIRRAEARVPPGTVWRHAKSGGVYRVECVAIEEATLSVVVVYRLRDGAAPVTFTRPYREFTDGRFTIIEEKDQ